MNGAIIITVCISALTAIACWRDMAALYFRHGLAYATVAMLTRCAINTTVSLMLYLFLVLMLNLIFG